ncbi:MAG: hypothetical protein ACREB2_00210 [Pseudolabrys sp.]
MGVRLAAIAVLCALYAAPTLAQKSTEDGLRDCEKLAAIKFKQEISAFKKFAITRGDSVEEDKFAGKVGTQFVSTVYHGSATYQAGGAPDEVRFICLHGGLGKGAVFVYLLPR